jgi:hypothetical protein
MRHNGVTFLNWRLSVFIWFFLFLFPPVVCGDVRVRKRRRTERGGGSPPPDSDPLSDIELMKISPACQDKFAAGANRRFKFHKSSQFFIRSRNETLSVAAMRVSNPDGSPFGIDSCDPAQTPPAFLEIVGDDLPSTSSTQGPPTGCFRLVAAQVCLVPLCPLLSELALSAPSQSQ